MAAGKLKLPLALVLTVDMGRGQQPKQWGAAWAGGAAKADSSVEVPAAVAAAAGVADGVRCSVRAVNSPPAQRVIVEPASADDWEVLEQNAEYVEGQLLRQVGVVVEGQPFPVWIRGQSTLMLRPTQVVPGPMAQLTDGSELAIAPRTRQQEAKEANAMAEQMQKALGLSGAFAGGAPAAAAQQPAAAEHAPEPAQPRAKERTLAMLRVQAATQNFGYARVLDEATKGELGYNVGVSAVCLVAPDTAREMRVQEGQVVRLTRRHADEGASTLVCVVRMSPKGIAHRHVCLSQAARWALNAGAGARVTVTLPPEAKQALMARPVSLVPLVMQKPKPPRKGPTGALLAAAGVESGSGKRTPFQTIFARWVAAQCRKGGLKSVPVASGSVIQVRDAMAPPFSRGEAYMLQFAGDASGGYQMVTPAQFAERERCPNLQLSADLAVRPLADDEAVLAGAPLLTQLPWLRPMADEVMEAITPLLGPGTAPRAGAIIHGASGSGKSPLALAIARVLNEPTGKSGVPPIHCHVLACQKLVGEAAPDICEILLQVWRIAERHSPALVVLDGLDLLLPVRASGADGDSGVDAVAEHLADMMDSSAQGPNGVAWLATANDPEGLHALVRAAGRLDVPVGLVSPEESARRDLFVARGAARNLLVGRQAAAVAAAATDGCDAADVELLLERALHCATARYLHAQPPASGQFELTAQDFNAAKDGFSAAAFSGTGKGGSSSVDKSLGWDDIGGLDEVKDQLWEVLEMPAQYSELFQSAPLRARTGVLLFGPPGCGKTHVARCAAAACGLRHISVKGPELLNKYIGQSEAAVRELFLKARNAAPCALFFDEFDALAPRRGNDSTGVTDRVVNQLLTELDGVEALQGVVVVAATSRPDLIDPALLRPGRLDRLLHVNFPSDVERTEIMRAIGRKARLAEDLADGEMLARVAADVPGLTGADLAALMSDAQLAAAHEALEAGKRGEKREAKISYAHVMKALTQLRPSVPPIEAARLELIYASFLAGRKASSYDAAADAADRRRKGKMKATLA